MDILSEKLQYKNQLEHALGDKIRFPVLWGEDLTDSKIILYPGKIKELPGYKDIAPFLTNVCLVYFNFRAANYIKGSVERWDPGQKEIYISENNFNSIWKHLRNSVDKGIRIRLQEGKICPIKEAEDILDLTKIQTKTRTAFIKDGQLVYRESPLTESEIIELGKKQSILDNINNRYFYSDTENCFHDRECACIKKIPPASFHGSSSMPSGYNYCRLCRRKVYLREACSPHVKDMGRVNHFLTIHSISDRQLQRYALDYKLKFRMKKRDELIVKGGEDTWKIMKYADGEVALWHNNYIKITPEERCIISGYHEQGVYSQLLSILLEYINGYDYKKHLEAEGNKPNEDPVPESVHDEIETKEDTVLEKREPQGLFDRLYKWISGLFDKWNY